MGFQVDSAVVTAATPAGAQVNDSDLAWRDASTTWGDARLLTSICLATE